MRKLILAAILVFPQMAPAQELPAEKVLVLACLENLDQGTTWPQCAGLMFQPCEGEEVGSEGHVACLKGEREGWGREMEGLQTQVFDSITTGGTSELVDVLGQWTGYVGQKCQEVAAQRVETGAESARLGCEITEMVGLVGEFAACLEGRSAAPYCEFK